MKLSKNLLMAAICLALGTGHAMAMPTGGSIMAGGDNIKNFVENPASGAVIDFTGNGVINWNAFNIGTDEALTFNVAQNAMAFNYVSGGDISTILGHLTQSGEGSMVLCNPNGIVVGNGAVINANDLTMMTMQLDNDQLKNIFTDAGYSSIMPALKEGRVAIADGVYISIGADVQIGDTAGSGINSFSARSAGRMMASLADSVEDDFTDKWEEIISGNPSTEELEAMIRKYLDAGHRAEDLMKQIVLSNISIKKQSKILLMILQSQKSTAEADSQTKNMSAFTEANNLSKAEGASTRTSGVSKYVDLRKSQFAPLEGQVTFGSGENATTIYGGQPAAVLFQQKSEDTGRLNNPRDFEQSVEQVELRAPDYIKNGFKLTSENTKKLGLDSGADDKKLEQIVNEMKEMLNSPNTSSTSNDVETVNVSAGDIKPGGLLVDTGLSVIGEKTDNVSAGDIKTGGLLAATGMGLIGSEKTDNVSVAEGGVLGGTLSIGGEKTDEPLRAGTLTVSAGDAKIDTSLQSNLTVGSLTNRDRLFAD